MRVLVGISAALTVGLFLTLASLDDVDASEGGGTVQINYPVYPPAPEYQLQSEADDKSAGCVSCHEPMDRKTMHRSSAVVIGCTDCHGGNPRAFRKDGQAMDTPEYDKIKLEAHVPASQPSLWHGPANPVRSYTLLNSEAFQYVRFVNPGDLRVAREACGACHSQLIGKVERSLMSTAAMFWGGAAYNNGVLPYKRYIVGSSYTRDGTPAQIESVVPVTDDMRRRGMLPFLAPLPSWETVPPADNFRIFERGGRLVGNVFPETGLPNPFDEPGKPDVKQSNRGVGTGSRISVPVLNLHKTRLNDPFLWFMGTSDNPGDFRQSGCSGCHVIYANDREWASSGSYAEYGNKGQTITVDPTIKDRRASAKVDPNEQGNPAPYFSLAAEGEKESGHPLKHEFTRAIPTAMCMTCHHHQPNQFVNSYLGYTMWDYESDAEHMWPDKQQYPEIKEMHETLERNPEEAAVRGNWADPKFTAEVWKDVNPKTKHTKFADYHGHGWNFRGIFKKDRKGNFLDADGKIIPHDTPNDEKFKRAVHMRDIHADYGMQCADCHFSQDSHGDGMIYGETASAVEIECRDCHGTVDARATLRTSGPAAPPGGTDLSLLRNMDGAPRFEWRGGKLYQRLILPPFKEFEVTQIKDTVTPGNAAYNAKAARAKTLSAGTSMAWGKDAQGCERAHDTEKSDGMACYTCHSSWVTSCAGCHLPIQANWKTERHHFEGGETRNFATYNPQVARDEIFQLGRHGEAKDGKIVPIRSSSALILSSTDINRNRIYVQQPPISSAGLSSQAFAPHFPHTVRKTETKTCSDCHLSEAGDNNALMAQLLLQGTQFVNFVGYNAWVGTEKTIEAIQVTEWDEPQAVIGSFLHKEAYPDWYKLHTDRKGELKGRDQDDGQYQHSSNMVNCIQLRGEYLWVAEGKKGMQAYDVANIGNKNFSERFITAPFSPFGHSSRIDTKNATCVAMPTTQPVRPDRARDPKQNAINLEKPMHPIYSYAAVTDLEEGLILANVETMHDFEPRNNFFTRSVTWNPDGLLDGARHVTFTGHYVWIAADKGLVLVDLDNPQKPKHVTTLPLKNVQASMQQFRYLFVVDGEGLKVVDITDLAKPKLVEGAAVPIQNANRVFVSRTYAYVAAGAEGIVIVDVEKPEKPKLYMKYTADGRINDARDVIVASTNASLFAYVADGKNGLKVLQLTSPESQPGFYGFAPEPKPELISWRKTRSPALSLSRPLERDRAVDETGHQMAVFGRIGSRPFTQAESQKLYMKDGEVWTVSDQVDPKATGVGSGRCEAKPEVVEEPAPRKDEASRNARGTSGE
jgi:hypothetical protein